MVFVPETLRIEASTHHVLYQRVQDTAYGSDCGHCRRERRYSSDLETARMLIKFHLVFFHRIVTDLSPAMSAIALEADLDQAVGQLRHRGVNNMSIAHELGRDRSTVHRSLDRLRACGWNGEPERVVGSDGRSRPTRMN